jgi:hypothetical protein
MFQQVVELFIIYGLIDILKFVQIHINTSNHVYYKMLHLTLRFEHSTILIMLKI